ncbi:hypothetical protein CDL15_Pgr015198 [Punica granatum]|nr:hypothetical protein CDL15_Pgr015198 [Punica granatum]
MNSFDSQRQDSLKRMRPWHGQAHHHHHQQQISSATFLSKIMIGSSPPPPPPPPPNPLGPSPRNPSFKLQPAGGGFTGSLQLDEDKDLVSAVVPPAVTVVLEGRSICHRINLHKHESYQSLARALRQMFVDEEADLSLDAGMAADDKGKDLDLSNAIPGYLVAYEDMENDLLLAGDLNWK